MSFVDNVMNSLKSEEQSFTFLIPTPNKLLVYKNCIKCSEIKEEEFFEESENVCSDCRAASARSNTKKPHVQIPGKWCKECKKHRPHTAFEPCNIYGREIEVCKFPHGKKLLPDVEHPWNIVDITEEQYFMLWNDPCYYCGSKEIYDIIKLNPMDKYHYFNCVSACEMCKNMKKHMTHNEFVKHCRAVYENTFI